MHPDITEKIAEIISEVRAAIREDFREVMREFQSDPNTTKESFASDWLKAKEASDLIHVKSSKKWKALRDSGLVHYLREGKEYLYERNSLIEYQRRKSTLQYTIDTKPKKTLNY